MRSAAEIEAKAAEWLAREDGGALSPDEAEAMQAWLEADTAHRIAYLYLRSAWGRADRLSVMRGPDLAVTPEPAVAKRRRGRSGAYGWAYRAVASLALVAILGAAGMQLLSRRAAETYATPVGGREVISLADGSELTLNTDTRIRVRIGGGRREMTLDRGEAFFDVRHDPSHPFVVIAGDRRIVDIGTRFSVRRDGDAVKVMVQEGEVRIERVGAAPSSAPLGGQKPAGSAQLVSRGGIADATPSVLRLSRRDDAEISRNLAWRDGLLSFSQTALGEAAQEFNRYNRRQLVVSGRAASIHIDGSFRTDNVDSFARLMRDGFGLTVREDGEKIFISG